MPFELAFDDDFPQLLPDPPRAHVQFSVKWRCVNIGDEASPEVSVQVDLFEAAATIPKISSFGRNVVALQPGETDEDIVGVGAVGNGSGTVQVNIGGLVATIPITVT